jgi:vancomycin resistance protein YoaR
MIIVTLSSLLVGFNYDETIQSTTDIKGKIINLTYSGSSYILQLEEFCSINPENQSINIDEMILLDKLNYISQYINKTAADAKIIDEKTFKIQKEMDGISLDGGLLVQIIKQYINSGSILDSYNIEIPVIIEKPRVTEALLNQIKNTEISSFSTKFDSKMKDRTTNLRISTTAINGTIIYPGDIFSMDKTLGERTAKQGYKYAHAFSGGKVVSSLAGGICQTTTTMYNAALFANLQIIERYRHGLPVTYINKGRDATIYAHTYDLRFKNNTQYPIYIKSYIDTSKGLLYVKLYGYKKEYNIKVTTEYQRKNGKNYYYTYRYVYNTSNVLLKKELISTDVFS